LYSLPRQSSQSKCPGLKINKNITNLHNQQNPTIFRSVVQPNTRFGQALSSTNKFNSTNQQQTPMRTAQNQQQHAGNFAAAFNRTKGRFFGIKIAYIDKLYFSFFSELSDLLS
jgi:hypothetical protein